MVVIDKGKCIGCGICVNDCMSKNIGIVNTKAIVKKTTCFRCGHCIAVCPQNSVSMDEYDMGEVEEYDNKTFAIEPENMLHFIKFRRSVRQYREQPVEDYKLLMIIEAGRFTATGSNRQNNSYIVVRENIQQLRSLSLERLNEIARVTLPQPRQDPILVSYAQRWISMYKSDKEQPGKNDELFFNAPIVLLIVAESTVDAALAASNMELMSVTQGLGVCYCGFFVRSAQDNPKINKLLGLSVSQEVKVCMMIGYPSVTYLRTVPRKPAKIYWF